MYRRCRITGITILITFLIPALSWAAYTNSRLINMTIYAIDEGSGMGLGAQMAFSNDLENWSETEPFDSVKENWDLTAYGGGEKDGPRTIYLKLKDVAGNWSSPKLIITLILDLTFSLDTDGDGMSDWWENKYGLDIYANDAGQDYDQDGITNLEEFLSGWDPMHYAQTLYVDDNAFDGGDGSADSPLKNIFQAIELAIAGDTILVLDGDYPEGRGLVMKEGVDLISAVGYQSNINLEGTGFIEAANHSTLSGFKIINPLSGGQAIKCSGTSPTIFNNVIIPSVENAAGILTTDSSSAMIFNNTIVDAYIGIEINSASPTIKNNTVTGNSMGIVMHNGNPLIDYNNVWGNEGTVSCIDGNYCGVTPGSHDISEDPRFLSPNMLH